MKTKLIQKIKEEFNRKFTGFNDRGIVEYSDGMAITHFATPIATCLNCGQTAKGENAKKWMFGHIGCKKPNGLFLLNSLKYEELWNFIEQAISQSKEELVVDENTSDGYHTFKELYEFRKIYNAVLFNEWSRQGKYNVHKSWRHNDFELCFGGGWFVVMAELPTGQISNHYEAKDWDLFHCEERDIADKWDGHSAQDVITRLLLLEDLNKK